MMMGKTAVETNLNISMNESVKKGMEMIASYS